MAYFIDDIEYTKEEYDKKFIEVQAHVALIDKYVSDIQSGVIGLEDVPEEYYQEVYDIINVPEPEEPEQFYTLDEAAAIIASEVAGNE